MKELQDWFLNRRYYRRTWELIPYGDYCYHDVFLRPDEAARQVNLDDYGITQPYCPSDHTLLCPYLRLSNHQVVYCDYLNIASLIMYGDAEKNRAEALAHYGSANRLEQVLARPSGYLYDLIKECGVKEEDHTVLPVFDIDNYDYEQAASRHPLYHEQAVPYLLLPIAEKDKLGLSKVDDFFKRFYGLGHDTAPRRLYEAIDEYASDYVTKNS